MFQMTPLVRNLMIANAVVFLLQQIGVFNADMFILHPFKSPAFMPIQLLTYMFLHGGFGHIFSNMLSLLIFGPLVEQHLGPKRFLILYFGAGLFAGLLFMGTNYYEFSKISDAVAVYQADPTPDNLTEFLSKHFRSVYEANLAFLNDFEAHKTDPSYRKESMNLVETLLQQRATMGGLLGASGAVFGVTMMFGFLFFNLKLYLLFFPFPIKAGYLAIFDFGYETMKSLSRTQSDGVAHLAHVGGMIFGLIMVLVWRLRRVQ